MGQSGKPATAWLFNAKAAGLSAVMRDAGTMMMFAGTPYAHLHICGDPWDGNQYHSGDRGVWKMGYSSLIVALVPSFAWKLTDHEIADVSTYIRHSWGQQAPAVTASR